MLAVLLLWWMSNVTASIGGTEDSLCCDEKIKTEAYVEGLARQVTVRIFTNPGVGSGVIIARQGDVYTVLTCEHVVADTRDYRYTVLTADGIIHPAEWLRYIRFPGNDLALVQFRSSRLYQVVALADSKTLSVGEPVYASGFPNWHWVNRNAIESTRDWGLRAFRFTTGKIGMLPERAFPGGYQLGYTNDIENGMSGGAVLDKNGRLIGINGRLKYPIQGISVFAFVDGTMPSEEMFQQMEALSWAIPSERFQQWLVYYYNLFLQ